MGPSRTNRPAVARTSGLFALGLAVALLTLMTTNVEGSFTASLIGGGSVATGALVLSDNVSGTACTAAGPTAANQSCSASLAPSSVATSPTTITASVTNPGTLPEQVGVQVPSCGLAQAVDTSSNADAAVAHGGITYQAPGPLSGLAIGFSGSNPWLGTVNQIPGPTTFTEVAWFKTTGSGSVLGFSNNPGVGWQNDWDRMIWLDPSGHVVAGVWTGATEELVSSGTYNDGAWHMVAVTLSSSGYSLYVDGALAAPSDSNATTASVAAASTYDGYWHLGWSNASQGWPDPPTSPYFGGSMAGVAVLPTVLSATQISSLYSSTGFPAYTTAVGGYSPSAYWPMQDTGSLPYTGAVPGGGGGGATYPDTSGNGNTAAAQGGASAVVPSTNGPLGGGALALSNSGWLQTASQSSGLNTFTQLAWFETTTSGSILSFENVQGNTSVSEWDRMIWLDPSGHVVAGVYPGSTQEVVSPKAYNDGKWHLAAVTVSAAGFFLYIDGSLVQSNTSVTSAQGYSGWWHIGWSNAPQGWPDPPSSAFFSGSLAGVAIIPTALTGSEISALYNSASYSAYSDAVLWYGPSAYWPLQPGQATTVGAGCLQVEVTAQLGGTCLYPSGWCSSPSSAGTPAGLATESPTVALAVQGSATLSLSYEEVGSLPPALSGTQVVGTIALEGTDGWNVSLTHPMDIRL
ncbi:MAG: LamG domain-containing protein [Acidimicrobiales bacterium]